MPRGYPDIADATACADGCETPYRRAGRGDAVLLLATPGSPMTATLFDALAQRHRVYAPTLPGQPATEGTPESRTAFAEWLRGFLDALGVSSASIVADENMGAAAVDFALAEQYRIARVVLILTDASGDAPEPASDTLQRARVPLLTACYTPADGAAALNEIQRFLSHTSVPD